MVSNNNATDSYYSEITDAGKLMEEFIESGSYKHLKELSFESDIIQKNIYDHLIIHESKRHEIGYNLVAKFVTKKVFHYDYVSLNECLYDRGLLQRITKLSSNNIKIHPDIMNLFEPYQLEPEFFVKPSFNKLGKELLKVEPFDYQVSLEEAAKKKRENMNSLRAAKLEYKMVRTQLANCMEIVNEGKINFKYGSLSKKQKPLKYNFELLTDTPGIQALIKFGRPNLALLELYTMKGFISISELDSFRVLTDIKLEFVILDLDEESVMLNRLFQNKMNNLVKLQTLKV